MSVMTGANARSVGSQSAGDIVTNTAVAAITFSQAHGYLPSFTGPSPFGHYQIIMVDDRGMGVCEQLAQSCYVIMRVEPATSRRPSYARDENIHWFIIDGKINEY